MSERRQNGHFDPAPRPPATSVGNVTNNPMISIFAYCGSSILMTVANKYVVSGRNFNLNFFLLAVQVSIHDSSVLCLKCDADGLCVQSIVCIVAISSCKAANIINYRDFNPDEARKWFPISLLLIGMIYTSTKSLQFLSIPVYTIFKNLTIILIAYGEVLWFGGSVTGLALLSFGLMVLSSLIAAWADIQHALTSSPGDAVSGEAAEKISTLNAGYMWMLVNCFCSASFVLGMRKRIKLTNFKDFDSEFPCSSGSRSASSVRLTRYVSHVLQQPPEHPHSFGLFSLPRELVLGQPRAELSRRSSNLHDLCHGLHRPLQHLHFLRFGLVCSRHFLHHLQYGWSPQQATHCHLWTRLLRCPRHFRQRQRHRCGIHQWCCVRNRQGLAEGKREEWRWTVREPLAADQRKREEYAGLVEDIGAVFPTFLRAGPEVCFAVWGNRFNLLQAFTWLSSIDTCIMAGHLEKLH